MKRCAAMMAAAAALIGLAADDPPGKAPAAREPQAKFEPRSAPGAGQRYLERFVGDWEVAKAFFPRSGEASRAAGTCRQAMIQGGRFLQSEFTFGAGAAATTGLGLIGFDPAAGTFTSVWTDSRQTRMSIRQSQGRFDGEQIVLYSRSLDPGGKESRRSRTVSRLEENGRKLIHRQYALDPDGQERLMMELVMTRKAGVSLPGR